MGKERQGAYEYEKTAQAKLEAEQRSNFFKAQGDKISAARADETARHNAATEGRAQESFDYKIWADEKTRAAGLRKEL